MRSNHQQSKPLKVNKRPKDDDEDDFKMVNGGGVSRVRSCENCGFPDMRQDGRKFCSYACGKQGLSKSKMYSYDETKYDDEIESKESADSISIWVWLEYPVGMHYYGCFGQQSYSYATNPNDIIVAYNYENMDKDWYLWLLKITGVSPSHFLWIQSKSHVKFSDMQNDEYLSLIHI